jgi:hypothetical protein
MKKLFLIIALISIGVFVNAQAVQTVPKAVEEKFKTMFPDASAVKWEKKGVDYQANFKSGTNSMKALFAQNGVFIRKEMSIPIGSLPPTAKAFIETRYPGKKVTSASKVTKMGGGVLYKAIVGGKEIAFDAGGKYLPGQK